MVEWARTRVQKYYTSGLIGMKENRGQDDDKVEYETLDKKRKITKEGKKSK